VSTADVLELACVEVDVEMLALRGRRAGPKMSPTDLLDAAGSRPTWDI
jgi:hypothetical protein